MKSRFAIVFFTATVLFAAKINAQSTIAQVSTSNPSIAIECYNASPSDNISVGQTFKSLVTATITAIQFEVNNIINAGTVNLEIYSCSGPTTWGSLLNTESNITVNASGAVSVDVSSLNVAVTAGNYYGFRVVSNTGFDANLKIDNNVYADGGLWTSNFAFGNSADLTFTVTGNTILPVQLISFTAQKQNEDVLLQWSTASEQNTKNFVVEHSLDGIQWHNIGTIDASGNSNSVINYSYTDTHPALGMNYYRLLQMDIDGKSNYSEVRAVKFTTGGQIISLITNPVTNGELNVQVNEATMLSLYDAGGRLVWKKQVTPGVQNINVSNYTTGIYFLKAGTTTEKILVQ